MNILKSKVYNQINLYNFMQNVLWLSEVSEKDSGLIGNKALELSKLYKLKLPVPQAFILSGKCFKNFLDNNNLSRQIYSILANLDVNNFKLLQAKVSEINEIIMKTEFSENLKKEILEGYDNLNVDEKLLGKINKNALDLIRVGRSLPYVALRSSIINQFQNQDSTFLNVKGISSLITNIKKTWSALFNFDNIYHRAQQNINHEDVSVAVIIQKMINAEKSGIVYVNEEDNEIKIETVTGMPEILLMKLTNPNLYTIDKDKLEIKDKIINHQSIYITRDEFGNNVKKELNNPKELIDDEAIALASYYNQLSKHYNKNISFEYAIENSKINILKVKEF